MDANVKIEPFWRVVRFKQQYWIQLFAENGTYRTLTKTTRKPVRIGDYLLVQASAGKCMTVVYLDEKQAELYAEILSASPPGGGVDEPI